MEKMRQVRYRASVSFPGEPPCISMFLASQKPSEMDPNSVI